MRDPKPTKLKSIRLFDMESGIIYTRPIAIELDEDAIQRLDALKKDTRLGSRSNVLNLFIHAALDDFEQSLREARTRAIELPREVIP